MGKVKSSGKSSFKSSGKSSFKSAGKGVKGKGKIVKKGKGKGKGKGKFKAASVNSEFWVKKEEEENRTDLGDKTYTGTVHRYNRKFGYGFVLPDNSGALPQKAKKKLAEAAAAAEEAGKEISDPNLLYFRKPDVNFEEGFKLEDDVAVTFKVYVDEKGAGACDVSRA